MKIGMPIHYKPTDKNISACGIINPKYAAYDARDCNCYRCRETKKYKVYIGLIKIDREHKNQNKDTVDI